MHVALIITVVELEIELLVREIDGAIRAVESIVKLDVVTVVVDEDKSVATNFSIPVVVSMAGTAQLYEVAEVDKFETREYVIPLSVEK
jgi:hypothetical protein